MLLIITLTPKSIYVTDTHTLAYTALSGWYKAITSNLYPFHRNIATSKQIEIILNGATQFSD